MKPKVSFEVDTLKVNVELAHKHAHKVLESHYSVYITGSKQLKKE